MLHTRLVRLLRVAPAGIALSWLTTGLGLGEERHTRGTNNPGHSTVRLELPPELLEELEPIKQEIRELRRSEAERERRIAELERLLSRTQRPVPVSLQPPQTEPRPDRAAGPGQESPLDRAVRELEGQPSPLDRAVDELRVPAERPIASAPVGGGAQLQLIDISLDGLFAAGTSTEREEPLQELQGGGHDPRKRGFTVQNVELSILGAVDPYLNAEAHIVYFIDPLEGETVVELEEAFFTTRSLPCGLQLEGGHFFTEFGRHNPTHPHAWHWLDQPVVSTRFFGPDGMRAPGLRLGWLVPFEWFSEVHVGMQNANGETMASFLANEGFFEERPVGGRPFVGQDVRNLDDLVYLVRWENSWASHCDEVTWLVGASGVFGPNATGRDGNTRIYGTDLTMKWKPAANERGWPFLVWGTELMGRRYVADNFFDEGDPLDASDDVILAGDRLRDWGLYTQLLYGFKPRWAVGIRYEFAGGSGASLGEELERVSRDGDPFRDDRHRLSPLLVWYLTEFCRFRLQYNFDHAEHIDGRDAHSFWLGAEVALGAHPAHRF